MSQGVGQTSGNTASGDPASVRSVARAANVSIATVSRVLHTPDVVRPATRARVLDAITRLGYEPSALGRNLVRGRSSLIGLLVPDMSWPLYGQVTRGVEDVLEPHGLRALLASGHDDPVRERAAASSLLDHAIDAGIALNSRLGADLPTRRGASWVQVVPEVQVGGAVIDLDQAAGGALAAHALHAGGAHTVGVIGAPGREGDARVAGFLRVWTGASPRVSWGDYTEASGYAATRTLLRGGPLDGLFAVSDLMAAGALCALREQNRRVPGDVSVIGFDDADFAPLLWPPLTTVRQPARAMGEAAARLVLGLLNGETPTPRLFAPEFVWRASARRPSS